MVREFFGRLNERFIFFWRCGYRGTRALVVVVVQGNWDCRALIIQVAVYGSLCARERLFNEAVAGEYLSDKILI